MHSLVTTFGSKEQFERGSAILDALGLPWEALTPAPGYRLVASPALVADETARASLARSGGHAFMCAGWVDYRRSQLQVPDCAPVRFAESLFDQAGIGVLAPCVADPSRIRVIAQVEGDLSPALPYLNALMERASYNPRASVLTYMDGYRLVSVQAHRITVAKADDIVDAWRTLEDVRHRVEAAWAARDSIVPSYETRERPPALEIYKRLPRTNCKLCGEPACLAFAVSVWRGDASVSECEPVYGEGGRHADLREALEEVCAALGV